MCYFLSYKVTGRLNLGIILNIGTIPLQQIWKNNMMKANFSRYRALERCMFQMRTSRSQNVSRSWQRTLSPKTLLILQKNNSIDTDFSTQWVSFSPKSMISFKSYEKTAFSNIFVTLHHIPTVNSHFCLDGVCYHLFI